MDQRRRRRDRRGARRRCINGDGAGHLAAAAAEAGAHIVHVSTDYVFAGDATSPYREDAPTGPIGAYGRSKLAGEQRRRRRRAVEHAIVRTAWVFGPHGKNFVDTMLRARRRARRAQGRRRPARLPDLHRPPRAGADRDRRAARLHGVLHVAGGGSCTWWELACAAFERAGLRPPSTAARPRSSARPRRAPPTPSSAPPVSDAPVLPAWQDGLAAHLIAKEVLAS